MSAQKSEFTPLNMASLAKRKAWEDKAMWAEAWEEAERLAREEQSNENTTREMYGHPEGISDHPDDQPSPSQADA